MPATSGQGIDGLEPLVDVDRLVHEPARMMILAHLYVVESADFLFLTRHTGLTAGNLSSHLTKLETAGYISIKKEFVGRRPHTILNLTERGRKAFTEYRKGMEKILEKLPR